MDKCVYCGKEAKFKLGNGKFCCKEKWQSCPIQKKKAGDARKGKGSKIEVKEVNTLNICNYGCGNKARYYFPNIHKYCCSKSINSCSKMKEKNRQSNIGKKRSLEFCEKMKRKRNFSDETRKRLSDLRKKIIPWNKGKTGCYSKKYIENNRINQIGKYTGPNNKNWKGGYDGYGEYPPDIKRIIKTRDNFTCQNPFCLKKHSKLAVHHIDYTKTNHNKSNLITLCWGCHSKVHSKDFVKKNKWKKLFLEITKKYYTKVKFRGNLTLNKEGE